MGITGLLPLLQSIQKPCSLSKFRGLTLGVDAYVWLHRAAVASAMDIGLGKPTTKFIAPVMRRVEMLQHFGITPYLVFDGDYLPSKAVTEIARAQRRTESLKLGNNLMSMGKRAEAYKEFIKAIDITPEMARALIEELKKIDVPFVVAPYEADAQLAYLESKGYIDGVISEDSDLLVFGIRRLLTKLDDYGGCIEINRNDFSGLRNIQIASWTDAEFRRMAILSGCDYLPNINRIGLKTAYELVRKHKDIERIIRVLSFESKYTVPVDYLQEFTKAELTFLHQRVFCPEKQELVMLTPFEGEQPDDFDFIGKHIEPDTARGVARGDLNPNTKERIKLIYNSESYKPSPHMLRRSQSARTPSEMKGKPIGDFFKSRRIPLAELDPNSLDLSPTQRAVLERQPRSIVSTPVGTMMNRDASSAPAVLGQPRARVASSGQLKQASKKQRLCADNESIGASETETSPFFASRSALAIQDQEDTKDELWSDQSLDEALLRLPEDMDTPSQPSKFKIFSETATVAANKNESESQSSTTTICSVDSLESSFFAEDSMQHSFSKQFSDFEPKYSNSNRPMSNKRMSSSMAEFAKKYTHSYNTPSKIEHSRASPALNRSVSATLLQSSSFFTPKVSRSSSRLSLTTSSSDILYPTLPAEPGLDQEPTLPEIVPESPTRNNLTSKTIVRGSEDCLVPRSDIESEIEEALAFEEEQARLKTETVLPNVKESPRKMPRFGELDLSQFFFRG